ncbi:MAG TPA: methyltransferase domain-containing protein [Thermoplasmata archaeon]|nr:methyltransferase domain-containing protein [Thermoplasmata archaeon]
MAERATAIPAAMRQLSAYWDRVGLAPSDRVYAEFQARRYPHVLEFWLARGSLAGKRVLDLGGGIGGLSVAMSSALGGEYELAEYRRPTEAHLAIAKEFGLRGAYEVDLSRPDPLAALETGYDLVLFVEVLEHLLVNPRTLFRQIATRLRRPGYVFVTTPNQARLTNRYRLAMGRSIRERDSFPASAAGPFGHVAEYTIPDLEDLLGREGWALEAATVVQNPPTPPGIAVRMQSRRGLRRVGIGLLDRPFFRRLRLGDEIQALFRIDR